MTVLQGILHGNVGKSILLLFNATAWETLFEKVLQREGSGCLLYTVMRFKAV